MDPSREPPPPQAVVSGMSNSNNDGGGVQQMQIQHEDNNGPQDDRNRGGRSPHTVNIGAGGPNPIQPLSASPHLPSTSSSSLPPTYEDIVQRFTAEMTRQMGQAPPSLFMTPTMDEINQINNVDLLRQISQNLLIRKQSLEFMMEISNTQSNIPQLAVRNQEALLRAFEEELNCSICKQIFIDPHVMECGHTFCQFCIAEWIRERRVCPVCRRLIIATSGIKHFILENMINKLYAMVREEARELRNLAMRERAEQARVSNERRPVRGLGFTGGHPSVTQMQDEMRRTEENQPPTDDYLRSQVGLILDQIHEADQTGQALAAALSRRNGMNIHFNPENGIMYEAGTRRPGAADRPGETTEIMDPRTGVVYPVVRIGTVYRQQTPSDVNHHPSGGSGTLPDTGRLSNNPPHRHFYHPASPPLPSGNGNIPIRRESSNNVVNHEHPRPRGNRNVNLFTTREYSPATIDFDEIEEFLIAGNRRLDERMRQFEMEELIGRNGRGTGEQGATNNAVSVNRTAAGGPLNLSSGIINETARRSLNGSAVPVPTPVGEHVQVNPPISTNQTNTNGSEPGTESQSATGNMGTTASPPRLPQQIPNIPSQNPSQNNNNSSVIQMGRTQSSSNNTLSQRSNPIQTQNRTNVDHTTVSVQTTTSILPSATINNVRDLREAQNCPMVVDEADAVSNSLQDPAANVSQNVAPQSTIPETQGGASEIPRGHPYTQYVTNSPPESPAANNHSTVENDDGSSSSSDQMDEASYVENEIEVNGGPSPGVIPVVNIDDDDDDDDDEVDDDDDDDEIPCTVCTAAAYNESSNTSNSSNTTTVVGDCDTNGGEIEMSPLTSADDEQTIEVEDRRVRQLEAPTMMDESGMNNNEEWVTVSEDDDEFYINDD